MSGVDNFVNALQGQIAERQAQQPQDTPDTKLPAQNDQPQKWEYKGATLGPNGEKLPQFQTFWGTDIKAQGWTPEGKPYFGPGILGTLKSYAWNFSKDIKGPTEADANQLGIDYAAAQQANAGQALGSIPTSGGQVEAQSKYWQDLFQYGWKAVANDKSPIKLPARAVGTGIQAITDLFGEGANKIEQAGGAVEGFKMVASNVQSPLPRLDESAWTRGLQNNPLGLTYDTLRLVFSPTDGKWDQAKQDIFEGWQAGRLLYSQAFDKTLREQFVERYRAGEDPQLLALEMQNPLAEMGGRLIFDPLNIIGAATRAAKVNDAVKAAETSTLASGAFRDSRFVEAWRGLASATTDAEAVDKWKIVVQAQQTAAQAVRDGKILTNSYGITSLTTGSKAGDFIAVGGDFVKGGAQALLHSGYSYDDIAGVFAAGVKSVSTDSTVAQEGLSVLLHTPNPSYWMNDDALTTFNVVHNLLVDESGAIQTEKVLALAKSTNFEDFAAKASKLLVGAAKNQFADINEMETAFNAVKEAEKVGGTVSKHTRDLAQAYEQVPEYAKFFNRVNEGLPGQVKGWINKTLGTFYFNLQGGVAVKNMGNNNVMIGLDEGLRAFVGSEVKVSEAGQVTTPAKVWTDGAIDDYLKAMFGFEPSSTSGFKTLSQSEGAKPLLFGKWMDWGESAGAKRITASSVRDTVKAMLPVAFGDPIALKEAGMTDGQIKVYQALVQQHSLNPLEALAEFRKIVSGPKGQEAFDTWRHLDYVTGYRRDALEDYGFWDEIVSLTKNANSKADIEQAFAKFDGIVQEYAQKALKDVPGMSNGNLGAHIFGRLSDAEAHGMLPKGSSAVYSQVMEASHQAQQEALGAARTAVNDLLMRKDIPDAEKMAIRAAHENLLGLLDNSGANTKKTADAIVESAWSFTHQARSTKDTPELMAGVWDAAGLEGKAPLDLTRKDLLNALWMQAKDRQNAIWNTHFDKAFAGSEELQKLLGKYMDATQIKAQFSQAQWMVQKAQAFRQVVFEGNAMKVRPLDNIFYLAKEYGIPSQAENGAKLDKTVLGIINKGLETPYKKLEDVPPDEALQAFEKWRIESGRPEVQIAGLPVYTVHPDGAMPSLARPWADNAASIKYALDSVKNDMLLRFGQKTAAPLSKGIETALTEYARSLLPKMDDIRLTALRQARNARNFTLLNYGDKTYGDIALSYVLPYHFWYTRSYKNWISRLAQNPEVIAGYAKYKAYTEQIYAGTPDWYKQQVKIDNVFGIKFDHPLFFNLEASLNPVYGLTGVDFNDPAKRVGWWTNTIDDMGKFGPSVWSPIQIATATALYLQGEKDAAARWAGRVIPETQVLKNVSSIFGKPIELDPAVQLFSGGIDPYERNRVGRALGEITDKRIQEVMSDPSLSWQQKQDEIGTIQAQAEDAARTQTGELWDQAYQAEAQGRLGSSIGSWVLGAGYKARSQTDIQIDEMFNQMGQLSASRDSLTSAQYRQQWDALAAKYPYMDAVLLSRKAGNVRDTAYAYNVIGRIPPGEMGALLKEVGISNQDVNHFFESKGDMSKWTEGERSRFMAAVVDLGAMLKMPSEATKQDWTAAKNADADIRGQIEDVYGSDIWDRVEGYFNALDEGRKQADLYMAQHPEVQKALDMQTALRMHDPQVFKYYGSLDTIQRYYNSNVRSQMEKKYGSKIFDTYYQYMDIIDKAEKSAFLRSHPELRPFQNDYYALKDTLNPKIIAVGSHLPDRPETTVRTDFKPQSGGQQALLDALNAPKTVPPEVLINDMSPALQRLVNGYYQGHDLPSAAVKQLDYIGGKYNLTADDILQIIGIGMSR